MLPTTKNSLRPQVILTQLKMVNALKIDDLKSFLDFKSQYYNNPEFIKEDPIQIPKLYTRKEDIEIMSLIMATISWEIELQLLIVVENYVIFLVNLRWTLFFLLMMNR